MTRARGGKSQLSGSNPISGSLAVFMAGFSADTPITGAPLLLEPGRRARA
ncbi:hypothetical protein P355_1149 [Burkholderia cenocepacia KC-01]|nr:hypothetical protein P355_1149 [Burkholderia cenocepacia KC-01]